MNSKLEEALSAFQREKSVLSREFHEAAHAGRRCVVLLGRSYACARELSSNIPQQMAAMGIHVAPTTLFTHQDDFCLEERHNVSTAIAPLIHRLYQSRVPVLSLWLDGKPNIHADNRLTAFMENVHRNR